MKFQGIMIWVRCCGFGLDFVCFCFCSYRIFQITYEELEWGKSLNLKPWIHSLLLPIFCCTIRSRHPILLYSLVMNNMLLSSESIVTLNLAFSKYLIKTVVILPCPIPFTSFVGFPLKYPMVLFTRA